MGALVSIDGRYHGDCKSVEKAKRGEPLGGRPAGYFRFLSDEEWESAKGDGSQSIDSRAEAFSTLGVPVK